MANLLKPRQANHNPSYEGFDLSHNVDFTSSVGQILPVHFDFLIPGDKISISTKMISRTTEVTSSSPVNISEYVDYYFVPLECLYSLFPSLLSDTNEDTKSTLYNRSNLQDLIPVANSQSYKNFINSRAAVTHVGLFGDFDNDVRECNRLIELFKYGTTMSHDEEGQGVALSSDLSINFLFAQAYQAVWQYFFRDDKRVSFDPTLFNVDRFYDTGIISDENVARFFGMLYRPWRKDPFTIVTPSPLGGQGSLNHFAYSDEDKKFSTFVKQWLSSDDSIAAANVSNPAGYVGSTVGIPESQNNSGTDTIFSNRTKEFDDRQSLQQHRIAQAIEKLSAIWMQSGKSYKDMMQNLFGVKGLKEDWSKPIYIGSDQSNIFIDEVIADVSTAEMAAGTITGRGYGHNLKDNHVCHFEAKCHGIILALYSAIPNATYAYEALDFKHTYSKRNSFPNPLTDELGEQPQFGFELYQQGQSTSMVQRGWLPRFHELKLIEDRAFGAFRNTLKNWIPTRDDQELLDGDWRRFYVRPTAINNIMLHDYLTTYASTEDVAACFKADPLLHFFHVNCHKASKMSSYGCPKTYFG